MKTNRVIESIHCLEVWSQTIGGGKDERLFRARFWMQEEEVRNEYDDTRSMLNGVIDMIVERYYSSIKMGDFAQLMLKNVSSINAIEVIPEDLETGIIIYPEWP